MASDPVARKCTEEFKALYDPTTGKIACVLLQAAFGGSVSLPAIFPVEQWETNPSDDFIWLSLPMSGWMAVARMDRFERIARYEYYLALDDEPDS